NHIEIIALPVRASENVTPNRHVLPTARSFVTSRSQVETCRVYNHGSIAKSDLNRCSSRCRDGIVRWEVPSACRAYRDAKLHEKFTLVFRAGHFSTHIGDQFLNRLYVLRFNFKVDACRRQIQCFRTSSLLPFDNETSIKMSMTPAHVHPPLNLKLC